jgi:magnesium transporter
MFLGEDTLLTIQQRPGDVWKQVRQRLDRQGTRLRAGDASFLMYALLDAVVDAVFEVLDAYAERIEHLEDQLLDHPEQTGIDPVRSLRRELTLLRRQLFPMRELITQLEQLDDPRVGDEARLYLRDVHDHVVQALDLLETYHELGQGLADTWMNAMSTRMNEVMKVLTIVASLFIPISFLAGVFGMNFERIPGLHHPAAFVFFCCGCLGIVFGMLWFFRRRGWL